MNGKWSLRKKENGFVLFVNGQEAVDIFNKKLGFVTTIQPGKDSSQIWVSFLFFFFFFSLFLTQHRLNSALARRFRSGYKGRRGGGGHVPGLMPVIRWSTICSMSRMSAVRDVEQI